MSKLQCDVCTSAASRSWEEEDGSHVPMCESCWVDTAETAAELTYNVVCEECHHKPATETFYRLDGVVLDLCDACFGMVDHEPISSSPCEMCCGTGVDYTVTVRAEHPIRMSSGERMYVCNACFESSQGRKAPTRTICEDCDRKFATIVVTRDERTTIDVCEECYEAHWAPKPSITRPVSRKERCGSCYEADATIEWDCEDDGHVYPFCDECWKDLNDGADEIRKERKTHYVLCDTCHKRPFTKDIIHVDGTYTLHCDACYDPAEESKQEYCECPLPCNDAVKTHCDLCHGYVPKLSDD